MSPISIRKRAGIFFRAATRPSWTDRAATLEGALLGQMKQAFIGIFLLPTIAALTTPASKP